MSSQKSDAEKAAAEEAKEFAAELMAGKTFPYTYKLAHPIEFADETITELTFKRGKLGHLNGITMEGVPPVEQLILIGSRMCGEPVGALELLEDEDGSEVITVALGFFARCLGAGKRRSRT